MLRARCVARQLLRACREPQHRRKEHRLRRARTRAGTVSIDRPKWRQGSSIAGRLKPVQGAEQATVGLDCQADLEGVSSRPSR